MDGMSRPSTALLLLLALAPAAPLRAQASRPMDNLFTAYRAYRKHPAGGRGALLAALPDSREGRQAYARLAATADAGPQRADVWEIQDAVLDLARRGEPRAIDWILAMSGEGEGRVREGFGKDALELFKHPDLVARFWPRFEPHRASLKHLKTWTYDEHYPAIRDGYARAFAGRPALRDELLALLDAPE